MTKIGLREAALACVLAAALALGIALASERWGGLVPCPLCLWERWPYRIAIALGAVAIVVPRRLARALLWLAVLTMLADAAISVVHVGVEQRWWQSPLPECLAPHLTAASFAERLSQMPALPSKACEDATYLVPGLPISMAAMNLLYALALGGFLAIWLICSGRRTR